MNEQKRGMSSIEGQETRPKLQQNWIDRPGVLAAVDDAIQKGLKMANRLNESMKLDAKKLDEPFTR